MNNPSHIFRMTHYKNVKQFCMDGALYAKNHRNQPQWSISYDGINNRRGSNLKLTDDTCPHDYVPFYFSPVTAMKHAIRSGRVSMNDPDGQITDVANINDVVYIICNIETIIACGYEYLFTDRACNTIGYQCYNEWTSQKDNIRWELFNEHPLICKGIEFNYNGVCQYYFDRDDPPMHASRKSIRMAEFLIKDSVDLQDVQCLVVSNEQIRDTIKRILTQYGHNINIYVKKDFYT